MKPEDSNSAPLYRCTCKAVELSAPAHIARGAHWVTATRAKFEVFEDRVECGRHVVRFDEVVAANRYDTKALLFVTAPVLELELADRAYQFGFNPWATPFHALPWSLQPERVRAQWSTFSIIVRLAALAVVALLLYSLLR